MPYGWGVSIILLLVVIWLVYKQLRLKDELQQNRQALDKLEQGLAATSLQLSDIKARRKRLLAASTQALVIVEADYKISSANKMAKKLFGPLNRKKQTFMEWIRNHELLDLVDQSLTGIKTPALYFSQGDRILEAHARSIKHKQSITAVALAIHDVTELQRLSRARRDFVTNISHELRTPLASTRLLIETLLSENVLDDKATSRILIDKIATQIETLSQLAQELLDLSLIESGKMPLRLASYSLANIANEQINRLLPQADRKQIQLQQTIDENITVLADETMVGRVISNLLHNAIKFTDEGCVTISAEQSNGHAVLDPDEPEEDWVTVTITDTGFGIPPDEISRIFERFYKIDRARKKFGTGLGLAIAKHIIEAHDGQIWAENNETVGTTFYFTLPFEAQ